MVLPYIEPVILRKIQIEILKYLNEPRMTFETDVDHFPYIIQKKLEKIDRVDVHILRDQTLIPQIIDELIHEGHIKKVQYETTRMVSDYDPIEVYEITEQGKKKLAGLIGDKIL